MTRPASHDSMQLAREAESRRPSRFTILQPYVPGRRTTAPETFTSNRRGRHRMRLPADPTSVADLCERLAGAARVAEAMELLLFALADVLMVERAIISLNALHLTRDSHTADPAHLGLGTARTNTKISRPEWPLSSDAERQVYAAQAPVMAGGERFGWVRVERLAHRIEADELGSLRIIATALGQRLATLRALDAAAQAAQRETREDGSDAPNRLGR